MHFLWEATFFVSYATATRSTSSHTFTNSLSRPRNPHLRRILRCTGWCGRRCEVGLPCGPWAFNFHWQTTVLSATWLGRALAVLSDRVRATLQ